MIDAKDIEKLAKLSRIKISDSEKESFRKEIDSILGYVAQIKDVSSSVENDEENFKLKNVFREDGEPNESGKNTDIILNEVPDRKGDYVKVKKIIAQDI